MFPSPADHLRAQLDRLDLLLHREILRLRAAYKLSLDEFRGLYISDEQVDQLVNQASTAEDPAVEELTRRAESLRAETAARLPRNFPWARLIEQFELNPLEEDLLLLAAAPEFERKYEALYAYLNNDVTRKFTTADLASRLLCPASGGQPRALRSVELARALLPSGALMNSGLLEQSSASANRPAALSAGFAISPAVLNYLLGLPPEDARMADWSRYEDIHPDEPLPPLGEELASRLVHVPTLFNNGPGPLLVLEGLPGSGRLAAARALCSRMGIPLLWADLSGLGSPEKPGGMVLSLPAALRVITLQARLCGCAVYLERGDALSGVEENWPDGLEALLETGSPIFLALPPGKPLSFAHIGIRALTFSFEAPAFAERKRLWAEAAAVRGFRIPGPMLAALADRFLLTPRQTASAFLTALDLAALRGVRPADVPFETLLESARLQAGGSLGRLAVKVNLIHTWQDLVLPPVTLRQVREVADAARNAHVVYYTWQFEQRFSEGRGLKVMFNGASGTGKTMTAGVIARELGLDLYKIDLSGIVSKYIGETEKNLDRVFEAALAANAILFFDEADALFGKRSEVKDAHDRYANIEIAYLLQKIETHIGMVILATNLGKNIDEAFNRRMHFVVEFPQPDEPHRERLWRGMFPPVAPLDSDIDFRFLARQFPITGGEIRNAALQAAFLAAQDGQVIGMVHLLQAMARLLAKQGRLPSPLDFGEYYEKVMAQLPPSPEGA